MEISPAVQPPKVGDPITAKWASDLAAAVNSCANPAERSGEAATPYGKAAQAPGLPMLGEFRAPMPFDARVYNAAGTDKVAVYLPGSAAWQSFVYIDQNCADPSSSQTVGTATNPWVDYGALPGSGGTTGALLLAFEDIPGAAETDFHFKWRLALVDPGGWDGDLYTKVPWASLRAPLLVVASISLGNAPNSPIPGVRQYVHGAVNVGGSAWSLGGTNDTAWGKSIGNSSKTKVIDLDARQLVGSWTALNDINLAAASGAKLYYKGNQYHPVSITDGGGNTYTVLAKV
jgi:hypothetical protein